MMLMFMFAIFIENSVRLSPVVAGLHVLKIYFLPQYGTFCVKVYIRSGLLDLSLRFSANCSKMDLPKEKNASRLCNISGTNDPTEMVQLSKIAGFHGEK